MRGNLVRRLLVVCGVAVVIYAAFAALRTNRVATVSAAGTPGDLVLVGVQNQGGCTLGPAYSFCDQVPGTTGLTKVFFVNNLPAVTGLAAAIQPIPGMTANLATTCATGVPCDFTIVSNTCTGNVAAGSQCEIGVAFSPTVAGLRAAALTVTDAGGDTLAMNIQGTGATLALVPLGNSCTPPDNAFTYCTQPVGGASAPETFTLSAAAAETGVNISFQQIPGLASEFGITDFTIAATTCTGVLGANGSCTVGVEFTPKLAGMRSAALTATDANGDTSVIYLAGSTTSGLFFAITEPGPNTAACARENFFGYCNEPTSGTSATTAFTLQNTSGTQVTGLTITPAVLNQLANPPPPPVNFTVLSSSCTTTLAANATCTISVAFTPQATGLQQGTVTVTDIQGDVAAINLSGVGDEFSMDIVAGQSQEVTIPQGGTATFMAELKADAVFGQNGETVTMACPTNLPAFSTCAYNPCPITPTLGGAVPFSVVIVTSTNAVQAPEVPNPCNNPSAGMMPATRGTRPIVRMFAERFERVPLFPALLALLAAIALGYGAAGALPRRGRSGRSARAAFALAVIFGALLAACGKKASSTPSTATPVAVTVMNTVAGALDANGNPLNASRGLQITLDVIKGQ
jgi:hypothetical protein